MRDVGDCESVNNLWTIGGVVMAHECPSCGIRCHCNGDIDDLLLNRDRDVALCRCCPDPDGPPEYPEPLERDPLGDDEP